MSIDTSGSRENSRTPFIGPSAAALRAELTSSTVTEGEGSDVDDSVFDITMGKEWGEFYDTLIQDPTCAPTECWKHCSGKHDVEKYGTDSRRKRVFV